MTPSKDSISLLTDVLRAGRSLLLAGAGTSAAVGYPRWDQLVTKLAANFAPGLSFTDDHPADVDRIQDAADVAGRKPAYWRQLDETFESRRSSIDLRFHRQLISLGFAGLITTNFDPTLEDACIEEYSSALNPSGIHRCDSVELPDHTRPYRVFQFLRGLGSDVKHSRVLHLHGVHNAPDRLILGTSAYAAAYGGDLGALDDALRTLPRKTLWTLLATRTVLFVGFSMRDPFFNATLDLVRRDFVLEDDVAHFCVMPYDINPSSARATPDPRTAHNEAQEAIRADLPRSLVPIFYYAPRNPITGEEDHARLAGLITDLGVRLGRATGAESMVDQLAGRALEEL